MQQKGPRGFMVPVFAFLTIILFSGIGGIGGTAFAAGMPIQVVPTAAEALAAPAPQPMRLAETLDLEPVRTLRPATEGAGDQIAALRAWNAARQVPARVGFPRPLPQPVRLRLDAATAAGGSFRRVGDGYFAESPRGGLAWGTHLRVAQAYRLRLHLSAATLPAGTQMWVWGLGEAPVAFGLEMLGQDGELWTPSVGGEDLYFEVETPKTGRLALTIEEIGEIVRLAADGGPAGFAVKTGECIVDASCVDASTFDAIAQASKAVAQLEFVLNRSVYACSGGLLNNTGRSVIPYLLTAHHCFSTQAVTNSLEAFWDFKTPSCGGAAPDMSTLPRSTGGTLLESSSVSDFTFVRLNSIPSGRALLGWTASTVAAGTTVYRLSHPAPADEVLPQSFSRGTVSTSFEPCASVSRPDFLYSVPDQGGTFGGSSGSPVMLAGGVVVGQLYGGCGPNPQDGCDHSNADVDGAFAVTYPQIAQFLSPATGASTCTPNSTTLCIDAQPGDRRFKIQVTYRTRQGGGLSGSGKAIPLSSLGVTQGGMFWFFNATNPEMLIKVLDGCGSNGKHWVFYAATTNVGLTTTVTDTQTGSTRTYSNTDGTAAAPVQDAAAFSCP